MKYLTNSGLSYFLNKIKAYIASQLNSKASVLHTHTYSEIVDLPNGYVVDLTLDGTSSNAIANSAVVDALDDKSDTGHTHTKSQITDFPTLATVATSGSYNDLSNKPTTMTPKSHTHGNITNAGAIGSTANKPLITTTNGVITTGSFGTTANTFCQGNDSRLSDARTPTAHTHSASDITSGLATVATSGSYNDLSNKPTIPTVNNATLTIQKNGSTVKTFTANASSNVTANISVPTNTNQLTNGAGFITKDEVCNLIYPIGSIYLSVNSVDPSTIFGGTWERIKDKFLLSSGDTYAVGTTGGSATTTLTKDNIPSHSHTGTTGNESQGHTHSGTTGNQSAGHTHTFSGTTSSDGSHSHTAWTDSQGSHQHNSGHGWHNVAAGSDRQCLSNYYIGSDGWSENKTSSTGSHSHNVSMNKDGAHTHTYSGTTSGISANHTHDFTTGGISAHHTHSFTTSSVGSTKAFSNMPPYLTVNIWKRTA